IACMEWFRCGRGAGRTPAREESVLAKSPTSGESWIARCDPGGLSQRSRSKALGKPEESSGLPRPTPRSEQTAQAYQQGDARLHGRRTGGIRAFGFQVEGNPGSD